MSKTESRSKDLDSKKRSSDKYKISKIKDINAWAKDLKHNGKTANKYRGVKTVEDILKVAHKDGYKFTKKDLLDFNLDMIAGGINFDFDLDFDFGDKTSNSTETTTTQTIQNISKQYADVTGNNNNIDMSSNIDAKQWCNCIQFNLNISVKFFFGGKNYLQRRKRYSSIKYSNNFEFSFFKI